ncbi:MAG: tRNA-specific 2-thiouridylase MnmA [Candidatus Adlerbacteria bacterium]|nr:tRNA-specific 2-thiouridylase MnmA [Candidatus Adlerbacteria bacterium]
MSKRVFVGLSGGVDSAVSAALLLEQGYDVVGVFIRIALPGYPCSAGVDRLDALRVATHLKIPFLDIDLSEAYAQAVFAPTILEFGRGRTPNPDALCNREIKFGLFYQYAMEQGADFVATGHYAQLAQTPNGVELHAGCDHNKDQSYFLWAVPAEQLAHTLFPVGGYEKPDVRKLAEKFKLPNASRKDSQGLCFLGNIQISDMLERELTLVPGDVLGQDGKVIGKHTGAMAYTLGQRHGFEVFSIPGNSDVEPHYVVAKNIENNTITVSTEKLPSHYKQTHIVLTETNWIEQPPVGMVYARYRYRQELIPAEVRIAEGKEVVILHEAHHVPEGQSLVMYAGDRCFGGGVVDKVTLVE